MAIMMENSYLKIKYAEELLNLHEHNLVFNAVQILKECGIKK